MKIDTTSGTSTRAVPHPESDALVMAKINRIKATTPADNVSISTMKANDGAVELTSECAHSYEIQVLDFLSLSHVRIDVRPVWNEIEAGTCCRQRHDRHKIEHPVVVSPLDEEGADNGTEDCEK